MKVIKPSVEIIDMLDSSSILKKIELAGRVCYKSEDKITKGSTAKFINTIIKNGHESVLEHASITVKFIVDRGVSHEIVRHRIASYSQESTRYCNYSNDKFGNEITVIEPCYYPPGTTGYEIWYSACKTAEQYYSTMLEGKATPQEARAVLPNSLKTELVMTANIREWRHFLKLRTSSASHPQMVEIANMLLDKFKRSIPILFDDIGE